MKAIINQNIYPDNQNKFLDLNRIIKAKILFVVAEQDHIVNPSPSIALAKQLNASLLILTGDCGHKAFFCEADKVKKSVSAFLK